MIPNIIHFIFGLDPTFGNKPFSLVHYLAIKSAYEVNKPDKIYFLYKYLPNNEWFDKASKYLELVHIDPPTHIFGNPLLHYAHQSDVLRLEQLMKYGGIYMDLDTISVKPVQELRSQQFVLGEEYVLWAESPESMPKKYYKGLCNAVILSDPNSRFLLKWYDSYKTFRSTGRGDNWAEHSVVIPGQLAKNYPNHITILDETAFFYPSYDEISLINLFEKKQSYPKAYIHHLWESMSWDKYLSILNIDYIKKVDTTYNLIARKFIHGL